MKHRRLRRTTTLLLAAGLLAATGPVGAATAVPTQVHGGILGASEESPSPSDDAEVPEEPPELDPEDYPGLEVISGGPRLSEATPITAGRYVDVFPADQEDARIYSFERTIPGSIVNYGLTLLDDSRNRSVIFPLLLPNDDPDAEVETCGNVVRDPRVLPGTMPVTSYGGMSVRVGTKCPQADRLLIGVLPGDENAPEPYTPFELVVWETPEPTNVPDIQTPDIYPSEDFTLVAPEDVTQQVVPGSSRATAPVLPENGGYHLDLPLGEVAWLAMEVPDFNVLALEAVVEDLEQVNQGATIETAIAGPGGGWATASEVFDGFSVFNRADDEGGARTFGPRGVVGLRPVPVQAQTANVGPNAYQLTDGGATSTNFPIIATGGVYYIALHAQNLTGSEDATLPTTLTVDVLPKEQVLDEPAYRDGQRPEALPPSEGAGEAPTAYDGAAAVAEREAAAEEALADREAAESEAAEDGSIPWWVWVLGVVVLLVIAGLAVVLARRGGRRTPQQQGPGGPHGPGGPGGPGGPPPGGWGGPGQGPGGPGGPGWGPPPGGPGGPGGQPWQQGPPTPATQIRPGGPSDPGGRPPQGPPQGPPPGGPGGWSPQQ